MGIKSRVLFPSSLNIRRLYQKFECEAKRSKLHLKIKIAELSEMQDVRFNYSIEQINLQMHEISFL